MLGAYYEGVSGLTLFPCRLHQADVIWLPVQ